MVVLDYNNAMSQVRLLRAIASDMLGSRTLENAIGSAGAAWQGESADKFLEKCRELDALLRKDAKYINDAADDLERLAVQSRKHGNYGAG